MRHTGGTQRAALEARTRRHYPRLIPILRVTAAIGPTLWLLASSIVPGVATSGAQAAPIPPTSARTAQGSTGSEAKLKQFAAAANHEAKATFKLTYSSRSSSGSTTEVNLEQKPPEQLFRSGSGEVLYDGKKTYYCSTQSHPTVCIVYPSRHQSPLAGMIAIYYAANYVPIMRGWGAVIAARIAGPKISFSTEKFAGLNTECATWIYHGMTKYCVTDSGILAYVGGSGSSGTSSSFELTTYAGHVSSSDFDLPRGATITTLP